MNHKTSNYLYIFKNLKYARLSSKSAYVYGNDVQQTHFRRRTYFANKLDLHKYMYVSYIRVKSIVLCTTTSSN